jgi:hypothetical protein
MALVDDDQVEEVGGVFLVQAGTPFVLGDRLVDRVKDLGVVLGLLQALARSSVLGLGLDDRDGEVAGKPQQIIGPLLRTPTDLRARDDDPAIGERFLFTDLFVGPACRLDFRRDELTTGIGFALRHNAILFGQVVTACFGCGSVKCVQCS